MDATATVDRPRQDFKILSVISVGHFMSHFYFLALPPLFYFLRDDFGVTFTELGFMVTAVNGTAAVAQIPVGFMVDRYGARVMLTIGLVMMALGFGLISLVPEFWMVIVLGMIGSVGNSVFHPADYAILNSSITPNRMGRAFSIHTFAGHLGTAAAPLVIISLANLYGWRAALMISGIFGIVVMFALMLQWNSLHDDALPPKKDKQAAAADTKDGWRLLFSGPMVIFFLFFMSLSLSSGGMQSFAVAALVSLHDTPVAVASAALTAYLFCSAFGILLGGEISDRTERHDLVAAGSFVIFAVVSVLIAWIDMPSFILFALMAISGLGNGIIRPARDMMLRAASPKGSTGKVFGFVSAGIAAGSAVAPIPFGYILDQGRPEWVFYLMAIFTVVALGTIMTPKKFNTA